MPLDVNGYNETFKAFADFAKQSVDAGDAKAIARSGGTGKLAGRTIQAATGDRIGNLSRSYVNQGANNIARHLFKKAIVDMFGSESAIPPSVKNAMKLSDYGKGRPLTARRILAVKAAIDNSGIMKQKGFDESISTFKDAATEKAALDKGYSKGEHPKEVPRLPRAIQPERPGSLHENKHPIGISRSGW